MLWSAIDRVASTTQRNAPVRASRTRKSLLVFVLCILTVSLAPSRGRACACGCGVFEAGTASLFPSGSGGTVFFEYNFTDQYSNWHLAHKAPTVDNEDKVLRTHFFTLGMQYMFNRSWGFMAQLPYADRYFKTENEDGTGTESFQHSALGDMRIQGMYSGFSEDMSTGVRLGLKLATGDFTYSNFERDTEIGSGSTDLLLGGYHLGTLPFSLQDRAFNWYAQIDWDVPMWTQEQYHPGNEINLGLGALYNYGPLSVFDSFTPMINLVGTDRQRDRGANADSNNTGYDRIVLGPGAEVRLGMVRLYSGINFPIYQNVVGNQITTNVYATFIASYDF